MPKLKSNIEFEKFYINKTNKNIYKAVGEGIDFPNTDYFIII